MHVIQTFPTFYTSLSVGSYLRVLTKLNLRKNEARHIPLGIFNRRRLVMEKFSSANIFVAR